MQWICIVLNGYFKKCLQLFFMFGVSVSINAVGTQDEATKALENRINNLEQQNQESHAKIAGAIKEAGHTAGMYGLVAAIGGAGLGYVLSPILKSYFDKKFEKVFAEKLQFDEIDTDKVGLLELYLNLQAQEELDEALNVIRQNKTLLSLPNLLFYGPPGTGKSMTANKVAVATKVKLISVSAAAWFGMHTKDAINAMDKLFNTINHSKPKVLVFIDEADGLLTTRADLNAEQMKLVTHFLTKTGSLGKKSAFIFATNRADKLDPAIISRITYKIRFDLPDAKTREKMIHQYIYRLVEGFKKGASKNESQNVLRALEFISANKASLIIQTEGFSGRTFFQLSNRLQYALIAMDSFPDNEIFQSVFAKVMSRVKSSQTKLEGDL